MDDHHDHPHHRRSEHVVTSSDASTTASDRDRDGIGDRRIGRQGRAALDAAVAGWHVFPVRPRAKTPAVPDWPSAATTDPEQILHWWAARPWNVGISTGPSGLLIVDLDAAHHQRPPPRWPGARGGWDVLAALAAEAGEPPPFGTHTVLTPSGGRHLYFRQPDHLQLRNTQGRLGWRIDTRGHGGYVLAAGSLSPHGSYRARPRPIAQLPAWLLTALTPPAADVDLPDLDHRPCRSGRRAEAYLRAVVEGEHRAVADAAVGYRHHTLLGAARRLGNWVGGGALSEHEARALLTDAARGYLDVVGYTARQVQRDITDGLTYGARRPRRLDDIPDQAVTPQP